jgi:hypothetical protein
VSATWFAAVGVENADHVVIRHGDKNTAVVATCEAEDLIQWIEGRAPWGKADDVDGHVAASRSVFPSRIHRDAEQCILDVFRRMTFPVRSNLPAAPMFPLRFGG